MIGLLALGRFIIHIAGILWHKEAFRGLSFITLTTIASGTMIYHAFEPSITTWVDAYYFTIITLTTVGYGDMGPTTPFMKLFTTVYVFIGLGIIAGLIGLIGETVIEDASNRQKKP